MGVVVGDALGMPVQFLSREEVKKNPVEGMEGYGTFNMPEGTWSDDSSMTLAALCSIIEKGKVDSEDIMKRFVAWNYKGEYTPFGKSFDQGRTCIAAIDNYVMNKDTRTCGLDDESSNGNGSLMRIMPICLYAYIHEKNGDISQEEAALKAVNLGGDTDTIGAIACGLSGLYYGYNNIPADWISVIKKREWIEDLCKML